MTFTREEVNLVLLTQPLTAVLWELTQLRFPRPLASAAQHILHQAGEDVIPAAQLEEDLRELVMRMAACGAVGAIEVRTVLEAEDHTTSWVTVFERAAETRRNGRTLYAGMVETLDALLTHFGV